MAQIILEHFGYTYIIVGLVSLAFMGTLFAIKNKPLASFCFFLYFYTIGVIVIVALTDYSPANEVLALVIIFTIVSLLSVFSFFVIRILMKTWERRHQTALRR